MRYALLLTLALCACSGNEHSSAPAATPSQASVPAAPVVTAAAPAVNATGRALYETTCIACHASGVAGAPKFGDQAAWSPRVAQGLPTLLANAVRGKGAMPPKGGSSASPTDVAAAVEYMVSAANLAPPATPVRWAKEPEVFLGIKLAEPLRVARCPGKKSHGIVANDEEAMKPLEGVCLANSVYSMGPSYEELENLPKLGFYYKGHVRVENGVVNAVSLDTKSENYPQLLQAFTERYGFPTASMRDEHNATVSIWQGKKMTIALRERGSDPTDASVLVFDNELANLQSQAAAAKRSAEAKKF